MDQAAIRALTDAAFIGVEHSEQTEGAIVDALRRNGALSVSLVAEDSGVVIGHVAFSPVLIDGRSIGWFGLGPVSVAPGRQGAGVGTALIEAGLARLVEDGAAGCVVLGNPDYYARFGFTSDPALRYDGPPPEYFQSRLLAGSAARGAVAYDLAFEAR